MQPGNVEERRRHRRLRYRSDVQMSVLATGWTLTGQLEDLSLSGCYIYTLAPPDQGTRIRLRFRMESEDFEALAVVRYARPGLGMGVEFTPLERKNQKRLADFLDRRKPGSRRHPMPEQGELAFEEKGPAEK